MARRGGSSRFKAPGGTLGTLLRTTLQQAGVVREALERGAREGRAKLDDFRADRRRQEALAELGEVVLELIRKGEIDLSELPEARSIVAHLDELDAGGAPMRDDDDDEPVFPRGRQRFDDRGDDGTVSSRTWEPPNRRSKPTQVWRPNVAPPAAAGASDDPAAAAPARPKHAPLLPRDPGRKGGISFDDDEDLAEYMHPDDVPAKKDDGE